MPMSKFVDFVMDTKILRYAFITGLGMSVLHGLLLNSTKLVFTLYFLAGLLLAFLSLLYYEETSAYIFIQLSLILLTAGLVTALFDTQISATMYVTGGVVAVAITGAIRGQSYD